MEKAKVEDLMIPADGMYSIGVDGTFAEAVDALEKALEEFKSGKRQSRVLIVKDDQGQMVGKISPADVLRSIEPSYAKILDTDTTQVARFGYLIQSLREEMERSSLPWDRLCQTARNLKVHDIMKKPAYSQIIQVGEGLNEAVHRFVLGKHNNLFVTDGRNLVGVLDLPTLYKALAAKLKQECVIS